MKKQSLYETIQVINKQIVVFVENELIKRHQKTLKYTHYEIMRLLLIKDKRILKDISVIIQRHKSTVTVLIRKLVAEDLVFLQPHKRDKRCMFVCLTSKGKQFKGFVNTIEQQLLIQLHTHLSVPQQDQINMQLRKLVH